MWLMEGPHISAVFSKVQEISVVSSKNPTFSTFTWIFFIVLTSSSWLHARPIKVNNLYLNDAEFRVAILQRLGIPLFPDSSLCPNCDKELDPFGYHALTCKRSGEKVRRHNSTRDIIHNQARNSQLNPFN